MGERFMKRDRTDSATVNRMARPYRRIADLVTNRNNGDAYEAVRGLLLDWRPNEGPFPLVLDRDKEYHIRYDAERDTWVLLGRTTPRSRC